MEEAPQDPFLGSTPLRPRAAAGRARLRFLPTRFPSRRDSFPLFFSRKNLDEKNSSQPLSVLPGFGDVFSIAGRGFPARVAPGAGSPRAGQEPAAGRRRGDPSDLRPRWPSGAGSASRSIARGSSHGDPPSRQACRLPGPHSHRCEGDFFPLFAQKGYFKEGVRKGLSAFAPSFLRSGFGDPDTPARSQGWVPHGKWSGSDSPQLRPDPSRHVANPRSVGSSETGAMGLLPASRVAALPCPTIIPGGSLDPQQPNRGTASRCLPLARLRRFSSGIFVGSRSFISLPDT